MKGDVVEGNKIIYESIDEYINHFLLLLKNILFTPLTTAIKVIQYNKTLFNK